MEHVLGHLHGPPGGSGPHTGLDFARGSANQNTENGSAHFSPGDAPHWSPAELNP